MRRIITGPDRNLAYWAAERPRVHKRAFGFEGRFRKSEERVFARAPGEAMNIDQPPAHLRCVSDNGRALDMLRQIVKNR